MWSGGAVQRIEKRFLTLEIQLPQSVALRHKSAPGTIKRSSAFSTITMFGAPSTLL